MVTDHRGRYLDEIRSYLSAAVYPLQYIVHLPVEMQRWLSFSLSQRIQLERDNARLREENLYLRIRLQRFSDLQNENTRLRHLLKSTQRLSHKVLIADVIAVELDPFTHKMLINKGQRNGVYVGLPVLDAHGVLGQVVHTGPLSSTTMLITDPSHAIPVQVERTGLRTIAVGTGADHRLELLYLPNTSEIRTGDVLKTTGLGGKFPPGYPVGTVIQVEQDVGQPYAHALAEPSALLDRNREVLLVWPSTVAQPGEEADAAAADDQELSADAQAAEKPQ